METRRLRFTKITQKDFLELEPLLTNPAVMEPFGGTFSAEEIQKFILENLRRYRADGISYLKVYRQSDNHFIGLMGTLVENIQNETYYGVAYLLFPSSQGHGYAQEGMNYLIQKLIEERPVSEVIAQVLPNNIKSLRLLENLGFKYWRSYPRSHKQQIIPHALYRYQPQRKRASKESE